MEWWRCKHGAPYDPKWRAIAMRAGADVRPGDVWAVFSALCDRASAAEDRGSIAGLDPEDIAAGLGFVPDQVERILAALKAKELIDGTRLANWDKHQTKTDPTAAARQRAKRERDALAAGVTADASRVSHAREEKKRTEETKEDQILVADATAARKTGSELQGFETFWAAYPHPKGDPRKPAALVWQRRLKAQTLPVWPQHDSALAAYKADLAKRHDREPCMATTWLEQERWTAWAAEPTPAAQISEHTRDWADDEPRWAAFKRATTPLEWHTWFAPCRPNGAPATLVVPTRFALSRINEKYGEKLGAIFGETFALKLAQPPPAEARP
jgi:hypothetical protein